MSKEWYLAFVVLCTIQNVIILMIMLRTGRENRALIKELTKLEEAKNNRCDGGDNTPGY